MLGGEGQEGSQGLSGQGTVDSAEAAAGWGAPVGSPEDRVGAFHTETDGERRMGPLWYPWGLRALHCPGAVGGGAAGCSPRAKPTTSSLLSCGPTAQFVHFQVVEGGGERSILCHS